MEGKGVHVITVNDYLAKRDKELIGQVHEFLGLKVGLNIPQIDPAEKKLAYEADITYGIGTEFGFDYLRDNMASSKMNRYNVLIILLIIDEIDSVLIDEAKTPLGQAFSLCKIYFVTNKRSIGDIQLLVCTFHLHALLYFFLIAPLVLRSVFH